MSLFRLDASIRIEGSTSRALADIVEEEWLAAAPGDRVVRRHIGVEPIPATVWADAVTGSALPESQRTAEQSAATALATALVDELDEADALLFAVPLYNYGVSQHFKTYVDLVIADPRMAPGSSLLAGKPAVLATVRGGSYAAGAPREGWDHATGWMRRILGDLWGLDLRVVERELTLVGANPALDRFADVADELRERAESAAREHGRALRPVRMAA